MQNLFIMSKEKPSLPKGTRDFGPIQMAKRNYIIDKIKSVFRLYGFAQIETPALEQLSVLTGKYGDEGDQLLFKILNSGDYLNAKSNKIEIEDFEKGSKHLTSKISEKGLKYDLTVPFARFVVMNRNDITFPFKRFQVQPVWRADRPQKGRYREFYQCDADMIGSKSLVQESEIILMINDVFDSLEFQDYNIVFNHRKILSGISEAIGMTGKETEFCVAIDKLDKIGIEKVFEELVSKGCPEGSLKTLEPILTGTGAEQIEVLKELLKKSEDGLLGLQEVEEIESILKSSGRDNLHLTFDASLARGLSYYTGAIFEVKPTTVKIGSITAGGRYDDLTGVFGMPDISGIGISFGLDRIYDVLEELNLFPESLLASTQLMLASFDKDGLAYAVGLANRFRASGIKTEVYPDAAKMQKQFKYADKLNIPYVIVVGPEEMETELFTLKNMTNGEQTTLGIDEIIQNINR